MTGILVLERPHENPRDAHTGDGEQEGTAAARRDHLTWMLLVIHNGADYSLTGNKWCNTSTDPPTWLRCPKKKEKRKLSRYTTNLFIPNVFLLDELYWLGNLYPRHFCRQIWKAVTEPENLYLSHLFPPAEALQRVMRVMTSFLPPGGCSAKQQLARKTQDSKRITFTPAAGLQVCDSCTSLTYILTLQAHSHLHFAPFSFA